MGTKYTSQSASGYDASPPADDGSQTEANKVKWSSIKTKLSNVLKTFIEAVDTQLVTTLNTSPRSLAASGNAASTDHWKTIEVTTASVTVTLAAAATMTAGYIVNVSNQSTGNITVACQSADTIDTVTNTTQVLSAKECREYIVNTGATGYITKSSAEVSRLTLATEQATTSGTTFDFTIPSWAKKITVLFEGISTNSTSTYLIQLGDAGGIETNAYTSSASYSSSGTAAEVTSTAGLVVPQLSAAFALHGAVTLYLKDAANFTWVASGSYLLAAAVAGSMAGSKSTSAALTTVRFTTTSGDTFDAGSIAVMYE